MIALDLVHLRWNVTLLMKILTGSGPVFLPVCYTFTFLFIKKKEKPRSTFLEYILQAFIQRLIARGGIG